MKKEVEEKIRKLQLIEENLHNYLGQKQQAQSQLMELESAEKAIADSDETYQILGNIMVKRGSDAIQESMQENKKKLTARIDAITKQEEGLKAKAEALQQEVMDGMKDGNV